MSTGARPSSVSIVVVTKPSSTTMVVYRTTTLVVDLTLSSLFAGWAPAEEIRRRLSSDGFGDLRFADGFVFQHLVEGPVTIGALAGRLEVTQQAASKAVADLERRGYVARRADPGDARARLVALTARGEAAIEGVRRVRAPR